MLLVLGLGDNVVDRYINTKTMYPGGNALNFAVYANILGIKASYLGVFGDDEAGKHVYQTSKSLGIEMNHCRFFQGENGYSEVKLVEGDRVFVGSNKGGVSAKHPLGLSKIDFSYINDFDIVHTSCFSFIENDLVDVRKYGKFISMDFSNRYTEDYLERCCKYLDCASISCSEMKDEDITQLMKNIISYGCKHIVIATRGSRGALLLVDGKFYEQSPCLVDAVDTMGAGDSFITAFLTGYINDMKYAVDFSDESGNKGITKIEEYKDLIVRANLYRAAIFSSSICSCDGAFGFGKSYRK
ncbi:fructoselysine 6-kinase [Vallitalea longa]|uniref:Fructoselysine 6-kinase n=1 Tax=Vallitalea longa TaxID=2936439 RepID=A0A9W5YFT7_9FIRM|nr:PfkB family carbohydrate kinase [Vallitalea longa]GKX31523.1 fructoselysine 6-kinase [Vallitalea longa]